MPLFPAVKYSSKDRWRVEEKSRKHDLWKWFPLQSLGPHLSPLYWLNITFEVFSGSEVQNGCVPGKKAHLLFWAEDRGRNEGLCLLNALAPSPSCPHTLTRGCTHTHTQRIQYPPTRSGLKDITAHEISMGFCSTSQGVLTLPERCLFERITLILCLSIMDEMLFRDVLCG